MDHKIENVQYCLHSSVHCECSAKTSTLPDHPVLELTSKNWGGGSAAEMFEILRSEWNLKPIFTQKWAYVDMNGGQPQHPTIPTLGSPHRCVYSVTPQAWKEGVHTASHYPCQQQQQGWRCLWLMATSERDYSVVTHCRLQTTSSITIV